eukprot:2312032-Pyramimonas_sp.AAC.2
MSTGCHRVGMCGSVNDSCVWGVISTGVCPAILMCVPAVLFCFFLFCLDSFVGLRKNLEGVVGGRSTGRSACGRAGRNVRRRPRVRGHPRRGTQGPLNTRPCRMRENMRGVRGMRGIQAPPKTIASDESRNFNRASDDRVARLTPPPRWFPSDGSGRMGVSGHRQQQRNQQPQLPGRLPVEPYATDGTNTRRGA